MISVLLADDQVLVRAGFRLLPTGRSGSLGGDEPPAGTPSADPAVAR